MPDFDYQRQREIYQQLLGMGSSREPNPLVVEVLKVYAAAKGGRMSNLTFSDLAILEKQMQDVHIMPCPRCFTRRAVILSERHPVICEDCQGEIARLSEPSVYPPESLGQIPAFVDWLATGCSFAALAMVIIAVWSTFR